MSKVNELNETLTALDQKYFEIKAEVEATRLQAELHDAAQRVVDRDEPGKTVNDVLINTDSRMTLSEFIKTLVEGLNEADEEIVRLNAQLAELRAELTASQKDNGSREA